MPLAVDQPILASDIMDVRDLKGGKIFLLTGRDGSKLVLKAEGGVTGDAIKASAPVLKAVDATVKMKPLVASEVGQLNQFIKSWERYVTFVKQVLGDGHDPVTAQEKDSVNALKNAITTYGGASGTGRTNIAKLSHVQMSTLSVVLDVENKPANDAAWDEARDTFAKFIKALNKSGGLEKLGQIVAGDFFIGNQDRFVAQGNGAQVQLYGEKHRLKIIINLGNIILLKEGKGKATRPSMLDYMDPNTDYLGDTSRTLAAVEQNAMEQWPMRVLLTREGRTDVANRLVDDLNYLLKPEKSLFGMYKLGGSKAAGRVNDGIVQGIKKIKKSVGARRARLSPLIASYLVELEKVKV